MALMNCPECNKEVSDQAETCPNCGYSIKPKQTKSGMSKKTKLISIVVAVVIVLGGVGTFVGIQIHNGNVEKERIATEQRAEEERLLVEQKAEDERLEAERVAEEDRLAAEQRIEEERLASEQEKAHPLIGEWTVTYMSIYGTADDSVLGIRYSFTEDGKVVAMSRTGAAMETEKWKQGVYEDSGSMIEGSFDWTVYGTFTKWDFIITDNGNSATLMWNIDGEEAWRYVLTRR